MPSEFLHDVRALRRRARDHVERSAAAEGAARDRAVVLHLLNEALATEFVCITRYKGHYSMTRETHPRGVAVEFLQHAAEEQAHARRLVARIAELGGRPDFDAQCLRSTSSPPAASGLLDMLYEDLIAERIAIESYGEMIQFIGDSDPRTRTMLEGIRATEEARTREMADLVLRLDPGAKADWVAVRC